MQIYPSYVAKKQEMFGVSELALRLNVKTLLLLHTN